MMNEKKARIHLGGTARSPDDVYTLHNLGLRFTEIPITNPVKFSSRIRTFQNIKRELGIYYLCHGPREGDPNDKETLKKDYLPRLISILPLMTRLEMKLLTVHLWLDPRFVKKDVIRYKIDILKEVIDRAEDMGIIVCIENLSEKTNHMEVPFRNLPLLNMTLDLGHAELLTDVNNSVAFLKRFPQRIRHIHIHDNRGGDGPKDDLHLPVGEGIIDFKGIFRTLNAIGYAQTMTLELKPHEMAVSLTYVKGLLRNF